MIKFSLVGGCLKRTKSFFEERLKTQLTFADLVDVGLFHASLATSSLTDRKRLKDKHLFLKAYPATMDFEIDRDAFLQWFGSLLKDKTCVFYTGEKSTEPFVTSTKEGIFTMITFRNKFQLLEMFVLTKESTEIVIEVLTGLYYDLL